MLAADFHFQPWDERMLGKRLVFSSRSGLWAAQREPLPVCLWLAAAFVLLCFGSEGPSSARPPVASGPGRLLWSETPPPTCHGAAVGARLIPAHYPGPSQLSGAESPGATAPAVRAVQMFPVKSDGKKLQNFNLQ